MSSVLKDRDLPERVTLPVFDVERMSRAERNQRFREALILDPPDDAGSDVQVFLDRATRRYLDGLAAA